MNEYSFTHPHKATIQVSPFGNLFSFNTFCHKHILEMKFWASFLKRVFWKQKILQTMIFFSFYKIQNLGFTFSKKQFF